jgi:phage terminase small subunit
LVCAWIELGAKSPKPAGDLVPRPNQFSLTVAHSGPGARRLEPPLELGDGIESEIWRATVAAVPASHFALEDRPLLAAYCRAAALERRASEELMVAAVVNGAPSPWLAVAAITVQTMLRLATRLRLGPRAREPANRRRAKPGPPPSVYDEMMERDRAKD